MNFDIILETAEWLGKEKDVAKISRLKELADDQRFYITVWGHYSAGKSRLINNIFKRDILPVQTRETTAVLTYLQYGFHEECTLVYENGSAASYDITILKSVFQNSNDFEEVSKIDHIEVYLNDALLKKGLILVDTPGVNTMIQKHQDLAVDAIEQSGRILYVLGNAPTNVDRQFVKQIADCGIKVSFIRTKCDRFMETEENAELSLQKEAQDIASFIGDEVNFIPVSNEQNNKWFTNMGKVRDLLLDISSKIVEEMQDANKERLLVFSNQYKNELKATEQRLTEIAMGNIENVSSEIDVCESELKRLQELDSEIGKQIAAKVNQAQKLSKRELDSLITKRVEEFALSLDEVEYDKNIAGEVKQLYAYHVSATIERVQKLLNSYFDEIVRVETENVLACIQDQEIYFVEPTYAEVQQENSRMLEMYNSRLLEVKQRIEEIIKEKQETGLVLSDKEAGFDETAYQEAMAMLDLELSEIPSGMALRVAEQQNVQPSSVFRAIGQAADIALLLLPGDVIFKGIKTVANTTKVAQTLHKMGKVGEVIVKAGTTVGKNAKVIDCARDTAYALNTILGKRGYSTKAEKQAAQELIDKAARKAGDTFDTYKENKRSGNVLDALSVSYWTEKLGAQFNTPPKMEIDTEEQERRRQLRREITEEQQKLSIERIQRKKELGLLKEKEKELKLREQEEEIKKQRIEEEIRKQEEEVLKQARVQALENYKKEYRNYYRKAIWSITNMISDQYFKTANQNISMYAANRNSEIVNCIEQKKEQINKLLETKESGNGEIEKRLSQCIGLLQKLEMSE